MIDYEETNNIKVHNIKKSARRFKENLICVKNKNGNKRISPGWKISRINAPMKKQYIFIVKNIILNYIMKHSKCKI